MRAVELLVGVTLGILVGSLLITVIGSGAWQVGFGVMVAMLAAVYLGGGPAVERVVDDTRGLARRAASILSEAEPVPDELPEAIRVLADAVASLRTELAAGGDARRARDRAVAAIARTGEAYRSGVGFSGGVVVAQIRATVTDLLRAAGMDQDAAETVVRDAVA